LSRIFDHHLELEGCLLQQPAILRAISKITIMFMCIICLLHLQSMFKIEMDPSSYFTCLHVLELLLFIAAIITYGIYLSYMIVLFGIRIFNLFKYVESMSLISLILQHVGHPCPGCCGWPAFPSYFHFALPRERRR
jgi:small basic protein